MAQIKISAQEAQEKAESLKTKISQVLFRFQTCANKEKLIAETIQAITAVRAYPNRILFQTMKPQERCSIAS